MDNASTLGAALARSGLTILVALLAFLLAHRFAARDLVDSRRATAWLRATPWLLALAAVVAAVGLGLLGFAEA